ncbi:hypothetical protein GJ744_011629 [Endocarpon pusillum]|uniref:Uncharacterized protein n=1 Tax=Endocarpon pusillum TaxID=364733 RepID=A0A8H7E242_9EURO|nr:hypothetical protein GJ744_011629 [Endocarpon pusillum]
MTSSQHLWLAGSIFATRISPFGPAMGARLVNWARHKQLVGPIICWLFPAELGTHPVQRDAKSQVGLNADILDQTRDALQDAVQEGLQAHGIRKEPDLLAELRNQTALLQRLVTGVEDLLTETRELRADTYTVTGTITRTD